jgi:propanol-preferring alcohol dehydrogenase
MTAMVLSSPGPASPIGPLIATERADPTPGPGEVLLRVEACAVCRTDLQLATGDLPAHVLPIVPGHQVVGIVTGLGAGVDPAEHPLGSRVGVAWIASTCGACRFCRSGRENLCADAAFTGWDRDGGFATAMTARADFTFPLPDGFDAVAAAPLLCGGTIGYRSLHIAGIDLADCRGTRLGLYGFGASATCVIQLAVHAGCEVFVVTRSAAEQRRARSLGATWTGDSDARPPLPLDAAITFAPVGSAVVAALGALDRGGTVAINAIHLDHVPELDYEQLWLERSLRSVANVTRDDVVEFLALAAAIPVETTFDVFGLREANDALHRLAAGAIAGAAVLQVDA